ncbi:anthocyanidin 3-O-glucosyltransferase-like [Lolium perenne]|uniref:anthocyanidin 3-O-glucosyltransferase-like n=1 Tax=Lolium perenne TaxID=4522 RepID=UPI0021F583E2|nr:anthocyanidin 3-O-glucosyltransferase-like [Lolium perenne]
MAPPPHIAVVAFPFSSHAAVMLSFVHALAAAAPDGTAISFVTTADSVAQLRNPTRSWATCASWRSRTGCQLRRGRCQCCPRLDGWSSSWRRKAAQASAGDARVSCVVGDAFVRMAAEVAAATGAPWVPVWTAASCALLAHIRTDALRQDIADQGTSCTSERLMV